MNSKLAPTYTQQVGDNSILWFEKSNRYIIVENKVLRLIQCFLNSNSKAGFEQYLVTLEMDSDTTDSLYQEINSFLKDCNIARIEQEIPDISFDRSKRNEPAFPSLRLPPACAQPHRPGARACAARAVAAGRPRNC